VPWWPHKLLATVHTYCLGAPAPTVFNRNCCSCWRRCIAAKAEGHGFEPSGASFPVAGCLLEGQPGYTGAWPLTDYPPASTYGGRGSYHCCVHGPTTPGALANSSSAMASDVGLSTQRPQMLQRCHHVAPTHRAAGRASHLTGLPGVVGMLLWSFALQQLGWLLPFA
jgi:hypothetical protein